MPPDPERRKTYGGKPLSSRYRGVQKVKTGKFMAQVFVKGTRHYLGLWPTERGAALARDRALLYLRVYEPKLNLPGLAAKAGPASPEELIGHARRLEKEESSESKYLGVLRHKDSKWRAAIQLEGNIHQLGVYEDEESAARAYDRVARHALGKHAILNFPREQLTPATIEEVRLAARRVGKKARQDSSQYHGVSRTWKGTWAAQVNLARRNTLSLGSWRTEKEAALAHDRAVLFYKLEKCLVNFPKLRGTLAPASADELSAEARQVSPSSVDRTYYGISWHKERGRFVASIGVGRTKHHLGYYSSAVSAARAYDEAARKIYGVHGRQNFHPKTGEYLGGQRLVSPRAQKNKSRKKVLCDPENVAAELRLAADRRPAPSSAYHGVTVPSAGKYRAQVFQDGETVHLGHYSNETDAAVAVDRAALFLKTGVALNLPDMSQKLGPASPSEILNESHRLTRAEGATEGRYRSRYLGVTWSHQTQSWNADVTLKSGERCIIAFKDEETAARARDEMELHEYGADALLNFPRSEVRAKQPSKVRRAAHVLAKRGRGATSDYNGVLRRDTSVRTSWAALVAVEPEKPLTLGAWPTAKEAAVAHDRAILHYNLSRKFLNFPEFVNKLAPAGADELSAEARKLYKQDTSSRFRGVSWFKARERWTAAITVEGKGRHLGYFDDEEEAARAYDKAALQWHKAKAWLNFHPDTEEELHGPLGGSGNTRRRPSPRKPR